MLTVWALQEPMKHEVETNAQHVDNKDGFILRSCTKEKPLQLLGKGVYSVRAIIAYCASEGSSIICFIPSTACTPKTAIVVEPKKACRLRAVWLEPIVLPSTPCPRKSTSPPSAVLACSLSSISPVINQRKSTPPFAPANMRSPASACSRMNKRLEAEPIG